MTRAGSKIRAKAKLLRPASPKRVAWSFLILPKAASAKLPTRGMTSVEGTINGAAFRATLQPDGEGSHWFRVSRRVREEAGAEVGELVQLEMEPTGTEPEPKVPADLREALSAAAKAGRTWADITPVARRDWIQWITSAKRPETRARRIEKACDMLASGKRRACCFDRSGISSKALSAPEPAEPKKAARSRPASRARRGPTGKTGG